MTHFVKTSCSQPEPETLLLGSEPSLRSIDPVRITMIRGTQTALALVAGGLVIGVAAIQQPGSPSLKPVNMPHAWSVFPVFWAQSPQGPPPTKPIPAEVEAALAWAERESQKALDQALHGLDPFFARAKRNAPRFAERALSWRAQWAFVSDRFTSHPGDAYRQFVRAAFEECYFSQAELERAVGRVVTSFLEELNRIDQQMWQRLHMEGPGPILRGMAIGHDPRSAEHLVDELSARTRDAMTRTLCDEIIRASLATMFGEVLTQATVRVAICAGVWGAGAAASPITYGASFAAAGLVDLMLARAWAAWRDPIGSLSTAIGTRLEDLHKAILEGDAPSPGLRARCKTMAQEHGQKRRIALHALFRPRADQRTK